MLNFYFYLINKELNKLFYDTFQNKTKNLNRKL